ncbi:MAG: AzlC family ABC transporter permease [Thiofilum sp.]|uniref:AzlC family ABC transporter permease n=1 Tax=Thiofilum sp. TaxID=2212733 RepID=UPI0025DF9FED|nr:AzlC family ABC transporter permease [Thiofilum sp.]MBK8452685.1 AzlC family ABC transporter permease [Thiofilum sp.]
MTRGAAFRFGALVSAPMILGGVPFGIIFGSLVATSGFSVWLAVALSALVFAGSSQFIAIGLIAVSAPVWVIVSTTFIVNLRHFLYAADLLKHVRHLPLGWRALLAFGLTDETYAAVKPYYANGRLDEQNGHWAYLGSIVAMYSMWNATTLLGYFVGSQIPDLSNWGLEFAMVATFIGIITPYLKTLPYWGALIGASFTALALVHLPNNLGLLIAALVGVSMGMLTEYLQHQIQDKG